MAHRSTTICDVSLLMGLVRAHPACHGAVSFSHGLKRFVPVLPGLAAVDLNTSPGSCVVQVSWIQAHSCAFELTIMNLLGLRISSIRVSRKLSDDSASTPQPTPKLSGHHMRIIGGL